MSLMQLTQYFLWKSLRNNTVPCPEPQNVTIKEETLLNMQEIFDNDMICRVCTNPAEIPITDKMDDTIIMSAIRTVANISITEADYYPKYVCKICLGELKIAFQFKKKCEASDLVFRKTISSESVLVTKSQPMVMHDFSLILHQMKQKRIAQSVAIKQDDYISDNDNEETLNASPTPSLQETDLSINYIKPHKSIKRKKISTTHNHIIDNYKNSSDFDDSCSKAIIDISRKSGKTLSRIPKCKRCDLKFDSKEDFEKHKSENNCEYHACPLCGKLVLNLSNHERIVHSRTNKYTCHQCGKIYYSSGALCNHMHKHKDTKEFFCEHCPYRGKRKSYLVCHMRVHTGERRYLCSMCPLKFTNTSNLNKHKLIHLKKKFECSKCKRLFRQGKHLKDHFDAAHLNIRYRCSICGKDLCSRKKLLNHELRVHKREKNKLFEEVQTVVIGNDNNL